MPPYVKKKPRIGTGESNRGPRSIAGPKRGKLQNKMNPKLSPVKAAAPASTAPRAPLQRAMDVGNDPNNPLKKILRGG